MKNKLMPPLAAEDLDLVERAQNGDARAFGQLMLEHRQRVYRVAYRCTHHPEDALDLAQEIFLKAYCGLPRFRREASFSTWLYRIAQNTCRDHARRYQRKASDRMIPFTEGSTTLSQPAYQRPDARAVGAETAQVIHRAVAQLPSKQQQVFILRHYDGHALREIAELMGISIGSVKAHLFSATHKVRKLLAPYVDACPPTEEDVRTNYDQLSVGEPSALTPLNT